MKTGFPWPEGTHCVAALSVNFDAQAYDLLSTTEDRLFGRFSYGRYGVRAGLPRLLGALDSLSIPATFFVTGADARRYPDELKRIAQAGHELAARGDDLKNPEASAELDWLQRGKQAVEQAGGVEVVGYRAPNGELTPHTLAHLVDLGFEYDASFQDDDAPYRFALANGELVEIPSSYALNDAPAYSARHTHARLMKIWREESDALIDVDGLVSLTLQLRGDFGSTRAARIALLRGYLADLKSRPGLRFMTHRELATWTRESGSPVEQDPYAPHAETLRNTVYRGDLAVKPI